jgi:hypothetical protein
MLFVIPLISLLTTTALQLINAHDNTMLAPPPQVFHLLTAHLAPGGSALIASKKYYFGVGGGTMELQRLAAQSEELQCAVVFTAADGKSNVREIIEVRRV